MTFRNRIIAFAVALTAIFWLSGFSPSKKAGGDAVATRNCKMDAIKQSVCVYQAILDDVDKNYSLRGGGGISRIVQNSTSTYSVHLLQEEREDVRTYEVKVAPNGTVTITGVTEKTISHSR
ncbi:MAG TPA: hypothetical protein DCS31_05465 [Candidatus Competibacteraceae bacterium]|nr:hypothetical protein [Candidatus Competibacter denitrificans]HAS86232.1 hypothetical protein [Candidatus Competibacteraceae bacterium]